MHARSACLLVALALLVSPLSCGKTIADGILGDDASTDGDVHDASSEACADGEQYATENGCLSCDEATDKLNDIIVGAMDSARSCMEPDDCKIVMPMSVGSCYYHCVDAFSHAEVKAVKAAFEEAAKYCVCGGPIHPPSCPEDYKVDCVSGVCTLVELTDGGDH